MGENAPVTIPQSFIQELIDRTDIVELVGRYVQLKKGGANFMGLCPFHGEKSPSFSVSPSKQFFHCFGCGKNGNAIGFLMEHAGMGFVEAVNDLAQSTGLQVPQDDLSPQERERAAARRQQQATLTDVLEKAAQAYSQQLRNAPGAVQYLKGGYGAVDMGAMMATLVLAIIPIILFYLFSQKYIVSGVDMYKGHNQNLGL